MNCDVSNSPRKLMCSLVVQTHSTLWSHRRHLEINRSIAARHKRCRQSGAEADVQTAALPEHRGACDRESMLLRGRAGGPASAPANYRASRTLANGKWLYRVCLWLTENHQGPENSNCHLQGRWLFPCFAVSPTADAKHCSKCVKSINTHLKWTKIFLSLWNEKMHETDTGVFGSKVPQMVWVSRPGSDNQGKISKKLSSEFSWKRFLLQYVAMSGQDESLWLWHRCPRQSPKATWQQRIHTMVGKLKGKYKYSILPPPFVIWQAQKVPWAQANQTLRSLPLPSFLHLSKPHIRGDADTQNPAKAGRYKIPSECEESSAQTFERTMAKLPNFF